MKPLSLDLRQRVVQAYERGEGSRAHLARRFSIGKATVDRLVRQYRESGTLEAKAQGGSASRIGEGERALVRRWIEERPELTQDELAHRFTDEIGRPVSRRTMGRVRAHLGLTRKKSP